MPITYQYGIYTARDVPGFTAATQGWRWNKFALAWTTGNIQAVAPFAHACVGEAAKRVNAFIEQRRASIADSVAASADLDIPAPNGLTYRPYQRAGIAYALKRKDTLIGDAMRLGKTIQALGVMNMYQDLKSVLIICPASVKINWKREAEKWLVHGLPVGVVEGDYNPQTPILIINYDLLSRHHNYLDTREWDILVCDESHYLRSDTAIRTKIVLGGKTGVQGPDSKYSPIIPSKHRLFLSGTQMFVRPIDLWTICKACDPLGLGANRYRFVTRYCAAHHDEKGKWVENGASNLEELQFRMRQSFMIRREKYDVATEMPPTRSTQVLPKKGLERFVNQERNIVAREIDTLQALLNSVMDETQVDMVLSRFGTEVQDDGSIALTGNSLSTARRELAMAKLPMCVEFIENLLQSEKKVVVFSHHRAVVESIREKFGESCATVYGGMTTTQRQASIDRFVGSEDCRVFNGNIMSAGQGIDLSVADVAVFVELAWEPALMDQAEERIWAVTKQTPVTIYRLVVEDSLDFAMSVILEQRQEDIQKTMVAARMNEVINVDAPPAG